MHVHQHRTHLRELRRERRTRVGNRGVTRRDVVEEEGQDRRDLALGRARLLPPTQVEAERRDRGVRVVRVVDGRTRLERSGAEALDDGEDVLVGSDELECARDLVARAGEAEGERRHGRVERAEHGRRGLEPVRLTAVRVGKLASQISTRLVHPAGESAGDARARSRSPRA